MKSTSTEGDLTLQLAASLQCQHAWVPLPCPNSTRRWPVFHMHLAKMAGRSVFHTFSQKFQPWCSWMHKASSYGDRSQRSNFAAQVRAHGGELRRKPCFTSYEAGWDAVVRNAYETVDTAPLVVTMLRNPPDWTISTVEHDRQKKRHSGMDDLFERGCLNVSKKRPSSCVGYDYTGVIPQRFLTGSNDHSSRRAFEIGRRRLDASIFGLVEAFSASVCLWKFQFAKPLGRSCDCRQNSSASFPPAIGKRGSRARDNLLRNASTAALYALQRMDYGTYGKLYSYGVALFLQRLQIAERALGMKLLCRDESRVLLDIMHTGMNTTLRAAA